MACCPSCSWHHSSGEVFRTPYSVTNSDCQMLYYVMNQWMLCVACVVPDCYYDVLLYLLQINRKRNRNKDAWVSRGLYLGVSAVLRMPA